MIITGITAAAKMAASPAIEYQAAIDEMITAMSSMRYPNSMIVFTLGLLS
jgi:hypothetical protein